MARGQRALTKSRFPPHLRRAGDRGRSEVGEPGGGDLATSSKREAVVPESRPVPATVEEVRAVTRIA